MDTSTTKLPKAYVRSLHDLLTPTEHRLLRRLNTPQKIQDYLDTLPINFELTGETYMSVRRVMTHGTAHCFEGALLACAALAYHGERPLLMDFQTVPADEDHVIALFHYHGRWGAISKTNHAILRYRDPVYLSPRELAMSYFHEYLLWSGKKSLRRYSAPFDLSQYTPARWVTDERELEWLVTRVDTCKHYAVAPEKNIRLLRRSAPIELHTMQTVEWGKDGAKVVDRYPAPPSA